MTNGTAMSEKGKYDGAATIDGRHPTKEEIEVRKLADELFDLVQRSQGYAFVSDGEQFPTKARFFERIRGRQAHAQKAADMMKGFLKKYRASLSPKNTQP